MKVSAVIVGNELLKGIVKDENLWFLARFLSERGHSLSFGMFVGDDEGDIAEAVGQALSRSDIVVVSGGLGATEDDVTRTAVAKALGRPVERKEGVEKAFWTPEGASPLTNPTGYAPGFVAEADGKKVFAFPGVPWEFKAMVELYLSKEVGEGKGPEVVRVVGLGELDVESALKRAGIAGGVSLLPGQPLPGHVTVVGEGVKGVLERELPGNIIRLETVEAEVVAELALRGKSVSFAESCTGGILGGRITSIPGSSRVFVGSVVTYSPRAKGKLLNIDARVMESKGTVCEEVTVSMAEEVRAILGTDYGVAVTCIAGPGTEMGKPIGLGFVAVASGDGTKVWRTDFRGTRSYIRQRIATEALFRLLRSLREGW